MGITEKIDSKTNKLYRIEFDNNPFKEVLISHGYNYLSARECYKKELRQIMGFDNEWYMEIYNRLFEVELKNGKI